jgi:hypothetical protein
VGQWQKLLRPSQLDSSGEGGPLCLATEKNEKIAKIHSITSHFGHEDLVKIKLFIEVHEKSMGKAFYYN